MNSVPYKQPASGGAAAPVLDETELGKASALLHLALEAGRSVAWDWNVRTGQDSWFGDLQTVFGIASTSFVGHVQDFRRRVHPQDRELVWRAVQDAMENRTLYVAEFRVIRPDGSVCWLAAQGRFYYSPDGEPERMLGIAVDITQRKAAEEALRESEERLRLAAQAGRMYAFEWDPRTDVIVRSAEFAHLLGASGETRTTRCQQIMNMVHPDDQARVMAATHACSPENSTYQVQYRVLRPDGSMVWLEKTGHAFYDRNGEIQKVIGMVADITERKRAEEALSALGRKLIGAQEAERARIARNLHDDVGQRFAVILATLDQLKQNCGTLMDSAGNRFDELRRQILGVSRSINNLSHELHSASLRHLGMAKAMRGFCLELSEQQQVEIEFSDTDVPHSVTQETALCLFRILQEALHNAVKHSQTQRFTVDVRGTPNAILLTVRDSGIGFDPEEAMNGGGLGLISMQERLKLVNGELTIESRIGNGTTIHARAPLSPAK